MNSVVHFSSCLLYVLILFLIKELIVEIAAWLFNFETIVCIHMHVYCTHSCMGHRGAKDQKHPPD